MSGPGPQLVEARFDAKSLLESLQAHAKEVSKQLDEYHEANKLKTMEFRYAQEMADSAWRAAQHGVNIFN